MKFWVGMSACLRNKEEMVFSNHLMVEMVRHKVNLVVVVTVWRQQGEIYT